MTKSAIPAICCLLVMTAAAAAQSSTPIYDQGVAARRAGETQRAVELLAQAVRDDPNSADAQVQYGYALLSAGELEQADKAFSDALRIAPTYEDARVGLALIAERRGDRNGAAQQLSTVSTVHVEANELRNRLARARPAGGWAVGLDVAATKVDDAKDWKQLDLEVAKIFEDGSRIAGRIEIAERFGETDTYGETRFEKSFGAGRSAYLLAGLTPDALFRPKSQFGVGGRLPISGVKLPTILILDARRATYRSGRVAVLSPGIEQYIGSGNAWLTVQSINLSQDGNWSHGWLARGDIMPRDRTRFFAGLSDAPDVDQGFTTRTRSWFAGASKDLNDDTDLRVTIAKDEPRLGQDRFTLSLGTTVRLP